LQGAEVEVENPQPPYLQTNVQDFQPRTLVETPSQYFLQMLIETGADVETEVVDGVGSTSDVP
jgi:hypothetical protein